MNKIIKGTLLGGVAGLVSLVNPPLSIGILTMVVIDGVIGYYKDVDADDVVRFVSTNDITKRLIDK